MSISENRKAPFEVFAKTVEYYPMVAVNIILKNAHGEYLWIKRKNNPAKGEWWIPGGRIFNGETIEQAAHAILKKETGLSGSIQYISNQYFEEIFDTRDFDEDDQKIYPKHITHVHYISTTVVIDLANLDTVNLDWQSSEYVWSSEILSKHKYLQNYFESCKSYV
ncbi:MAG: NUDIX domain-containing protein [Candidatus Magasanikbacteria bacterium]|nr:NUDIX domain-containing protein [Candidatus Magasanikbacteria bacterium]